MSLRNLTQVETTNIIAEKPRAILNLYRLLNPYLKQWFRHKVADKHDQEELIADTILSILDSLPRFNQNSCFNTWVNAIAQHELVDYYRRRKIKTVLFSKFPLLEHIADMALGPQLALEEKEAKDKIYQTFKNLSEGNAAILRLRYLEGLNVSAICKQLNISYKAAESRLSRARSAFAKAYVCQSDTYQTHRQIFDSAND